jgi:hypothetical protein
VADPLEVTTWIGVAATAVSGAVSIANAYLRSRTKLKLAAIDRGSPDAARIVSDAVASFDLKIEHLTREQTFLLAREEIAARDRKHARYMQTFLAIAVVLTGTTIALATLGRPQATSFDVTLRVQLPDGTPASRGTLILFYGNSSRSEPIGPNGEVNVKDIPYSYRTSTSRIKLTSDSYELANPNQEVSLAQAPLTVLVRHTDSYSTGYKDGMAMRKIRKALRGYHESENAYPSSLRDLPHDLGADDSVAWLGPRATYRADAELGYVLRFAGPDGVLRTSDDAEYTAASR